MNQLLVESKHNDEDQPQISGKNIEPSKVDGHTTGGARRGGEYIRADEAGQGGAGRKGMAAGRCAKEITVHLALQNTEDIPSGRIFGDTNKGNAM